MVMVLFCRLTCPNELMILPAIDRHSVKRVTLATRRGKKIRDLLSLVGGALEK